MASTGKAPQRIIYGEPRRSLAALILRMCERGTLLPKGPGIRKE